MPVPLSVNVSTLSPSSTLSVSAQVAERRRAGFDVLDLGVGEPEFCSPRAARLAAIEATSEGIIGYTAVEGLPALRELIAANATLTSATPVTTENVIVTAGSKQALFNAIFTLFGPRDEVLVPMPAWPSYVEMIRLARALPIPIYSMQESSFKVTCSQLERCATAATRAVILNSPCNPTGAVYTTGEVRRLLSCAARHGWWVLSDEIYAGLVHDGKHASVLECAADADRILVFGGVAKSFSMAGWRIGWMIGPSDVVQACAAIQSHTTSNACTVSQRAVLGALSSTETVRERTEMREALRRRRGLAMQELRRVQATFIRPDGAFYLFVQVPGHSEQFAGRLLADHSVATIPGSAFGLDGWIRASYSRREEVVQAGFERIATALSNHPYPES